MPSMGPFPIECTQNIYFLKIQMNKKRNLFFFLILTQLQNVHLVLRIVYLESNFGGLNFFANKKSVL